MILMAERYVPTWLRKTEREMAESIAAGVTNYDQRRRVIKDAERYLVSLSEHSYERGHEQGITDAGGPAVPDALVDTVECLELLTDVTFLLYHQLTKGFRHDQQLILVKMALDDAVDTLKAHGRYDAAAACRQCGSQSPETSPWHLNHCIKD